MVSFADLRRIYLLERLDDAMLGKILPFMQVQLFGERTVIFEQGQKAENLFMLLKGKVLLEAGASDSIHISLGSIKPGYSFGWSSLISNSAYTSYAVCAEPCELLSIRGDKLLSLLEENHTLGYLVMEGVVKILKGRLERRTGQFLDTVKTHPDMDKLLEE